MQIFYHHIGMKMTKSSWNLENIFVQSALQPIWVPTHNALRVNRQKPCKRVYSTFQIVFRSTCLVYSYTWWDFTVMRRLAWIKLHNNEKSISSSFDWWDTWPPQWCSSFYQNRCKKCLLSSSDPRKEWVEDRSSNTIPTIWIPGDAIWANKRPRQLSILYQFGAQVLPWHYSHSFSGWLPSVLAQSFSAQETRSRNTQSPF